MIEFISQLPTEYQEVEYIESSGTQYIDEEFRPSGENVRILTDYMYLSSPHGKSLFGAQTTNSNATFPITFYHTSGTVSSFYVGSSNNIINYTVAIDVRYLLDCHANNGAFTADLNGYKQTATYSGSLAKTLNMFMFTNNGQQGTQTIAARLYARKIWDNDELVRDYVPCYRKADNVAGLYDLVNNVFYINAGSGVFAVGADSNKHAIATITPGGVIPMQYAIRRRMMMAGGGGVPISELPLGALINVGTDGGAGTPNYEIADKDNLVSGGVVLVRKNIYSNSAFGSTTRYPNGTLDNLIKTTIYNEMPQKLRDKMMDVSFPLYISGDITRKMFALTYTMAGFGNNSGVAEGKALQLYTSNASRVKTLNGSAVRWWLSSRHLYSEYAWIVYMDGSASYNIPSSSNGVVPAFVISSETLYDATPNTDGSYNLII